MVTIDCGLDIGVLGVSIRGIALGGSRLFVVMASCPALAVAGVVGRLLVPKTGPAKKGDRPKIGDAGGVAVSCCRFSNLDRKDDTGLIDDSSLPLGLSMLCMSSRLCRPTPAPVHPLEPELRSRESCTSVPWISCLSIAFTFVISPLLTAIAHG